MILPQNIHCECSFEMHLHSTAMSRNSVNIVRIVERIRSAFFVEACSPPQSDSFDPAQSATEA